ncbi:hypothetical protein R1sor_021807 [Riccia sorocarpa]|uniref:Uncharacterized protein n=1 Tax=Riccia sorocarpa TaxID=122646 RepID=A0ABD3GLV5_9MARC
MPARHQRKKKLTAGDPARRNTLSRNEEPALHKTPATPRKTPSEFVPPGTVTAAIAGRSSTTARKLFPGRLVSLRHSVELRFLRVEHSNGSIHADRSIARADEVFAVVRLPIYEDAFALKCAGTNRCLKCEAEGQLVHHL